MRSSIAALVTISALVAGCASAGSWRDALPETATLEVSNRSDERVQIVVRGASEGSVGPGERRRFRWLAPGTADVTALGPLSVNESTSASLSAGGTTLWEFGQARPSSPELADLSVENTLKRALSISVNELPQGVILPGDTRTLRDFPAAEVSLSAMVQATGLKIERNLRLTPERTVLWRIEAPTNTASVINDSIESIRLYLDGHDLGQVLPGDTLTLPEVTAGEHYFTAEGVASSLTRRHDFTLQAEAPYTWQVSAERGSIEVTNNSDELIHLETHPGALVEPLAKGTSLTLRDIAPGPHHLKAKGDASGLPYAETLMVRSGQQIRWLVQPVQTSLRVENTTRRDLELYVDASWRTRLLAGESHTLLNLGQSPHEIVAVSMDGERLYRRHLEGPALRSATWKIVAETGSIKVQNARLEALMIFVDGRGLGTLRPGTHLTFTGLEAGKRLFEAVDLKSGESFRHHTKILADGEDRELETWRLEAPFGTLIITNHSTETLLTEERLALSSPAIAPGETTRFDLPTGQQSIRLIGEQSGVAHLRELALTLGARKTWEIGAERGELRVQNLLEEPMVLSLGEEPLGTVPAGETLSVKALPAGPHLLKAQGTSSGAQRSAQRVIGPASVARWSLRPEPARLLISNDSNEPVLIRIDGRPYGRIEAESRSGIDELIPGQRHVDVVGLRSAWRQSMSLNLMSGGTELVELSPPMAVLVARNESGEALRLGVDGAPLMVLEPNTEIPINVAAGRRKFMTLGQETGQVQSFALQLEVGQAHSLKISSARARLVVLNSGSIPLSVQLGDRKLGEIPPGATVIFDDLMPGYWWLSALTSEGVLTHSEHRRVSRGETRSWLLSEKTRSKTAPQAPE